jgi:hydrogenase nickel incorporation protein HypB
MKIVLGQDLLKANEVIARSNRAAFEASGTFVANMLGSPGSGKTTLLEAILPDLMSGLRVAVIEGDLATSRDAERIEALGVASVQINTGGGCHLDAGMVAAGFESLDLDNTDVLFIENVGNLICPAGFSLGEHRRVVVLSVTEGDDKVEKYPPMFARADAVALNKMDLLSHVKFDVKKATDHIERLNTGIRMFSVCAVTGEGTADLRRWLLDGRRSCQEHKT